MIDPIRSLAFSMQANPGIYAVLVGSGVSRAANIPTGWELTLDLIRKLARVYDETCDPDPAHWYSDKFDKEADYSDLLEALAKTPAERQQLLRGYWEPSDREREDGEKSPTVAHRAIAALAAQGFIRVILTTNFDRLMETALTEEGLVPTVLSSPDQVQGALPLIHTQCCVFKVHGDYLDTRISNTPAELDQYPAEFGQLLDRIFDEFGLIVCGWSAEWDGALRKAICRATSRRFSTYWAVHGKMGNEAQRLISHRGAQVIPIEDADTFFQTVQQHVATIDEYPKPHQLSIEAAVESLKLYISEHRFRIKLSDLVSKTVDQFVQVRSSDALAVHPDYAPVGNTETVTERVRRYEAACSKLLAMATVGGYWAEEGHFRVWQGALERLGSALAEVGSVYWLYLQRYPATLLLYALGVGAVSADKLQFLKHLLTTKLPNTPRHHNDPRRDMSAVQLLPPFRMIGPYEYSMRVLEGMKDRQVPLNDWICRVLWPHAQRIISDSKQYTLAFDKLEMLMALSSLAHESQRMIPGAFCYRRENRGRIVREIEESLFSLEDESPFVICKIFGDTAERCKESLRAMNQSVAQLSW